MKLIKHFDAFLANKVNLSDTRIARLDSRVNAVGNFLRNGDGEISSNMIELIPQGSYAHRTIINPVGSNDDFDADVLLSMEEIEGWDAKDYVEELYKVFRASSTYRDMVSRHARCVKVDYADDFHIDVVPYMERHGEHFITNRDTDEFELTNPEGYNTWLDDRNRLANGRLVKVIRLTKYLRDYKNTFSVKSVILSILLGNRVNDAAVWGDDNEYKDVPTAFKNIIDALDDYLQDNELMPSIDDPSEPSENFNHRWDQDQYANFRTYIHLYRSWVDEAFDEPDAEQSKVKWRKLFGDKFGTYDVSAKKAAEAHLGLSDVRDTNQDIEQLFPVRLDPTLRIKIGARLQRKQGFRHYELSSQGNVVQRNRTISFRIASHNIPVPFDLYWKVRNTGQGAIDADAIRGQIALDSGARTRSEPTSFRGHHYVEVYAVKNGACVAMDHQDVIIK